MRVLFNRHNGGKFDGDVYAFGLYSDYRSIPGEVDDLCNLPRYKNYFLGSGNYWNGRLLPEFFAGEESDFEVLVMRWLSLSVSDGYRLQKQFRERIRRSYKKGTKRTVNKYHDNHG